MLPVEIVFVTIGLIIIAGYLGLLFFEKTKISEIILLLFIGLLIGPISSFFGITTIGPSEISFFENFLPYFASFALIIILFEGGMQLNFFKMIRVLPQSFVFTVMVFILTTGFVAGVMIAFGFDFIFSLMIGAILGGTSSEVIIPLINRSSTNTDTKMLLGLESALTDALCVVLAVAIAEIILANKFDAISISSRITAAFGVGILIGTIGAFAWLRVLDNMKGKPYEYLLTIAFLFTLYSLTQILSGNGAIAVLVFGIILGNSEEITSMLRLTKRSVDSSIKSFQAEIAFMTRTFFFVYLGILFKLDYLNSKIVLIAIFTVISILIARFIGTKVFAKFKKEFKKDEKVIVFSTARGLTTIVLASLPITMSLGLNTKTISELIAIVFLVILFTNILTTIGVFSAEEKGNVDKEGKYLEKIQLSKKNLE